MSFENFQNELESETGELESNLEEALLALTFLLWRADQDPIRFGNRLDRARRRVRRMLRRSYEAAFLAAATNQTKSLTGKTRISAATRSLMRANSARYADFALRRAERRLVGFTIKAPSPGIPGEPLKLRRPVLAAVPPYAKLIAPMATQVAGRDGVDTVGEEQKARFKRFVRYEKRDEPRRHSELEGTVIPRNEDWAMVDKFGATHHVPWPGHSALPGHEVYRCGHGNWYQHTSDPNEPLKAVLATGARGGPPPD